MFGETMHITDRHKNMNLLLHSKTNFRMRVPPYCMQSSTITQMTSSDLHTNRNSCHFFILVESEAIFYGHRSNETSKTQENLESSIQVSKEKDNAKYSNVT